MKYDALIFDLDGTLWDASSSCAKGWTNCLQKMGIDKTVTPREIMKVSGLPYKKCIEVILPGLLDKYSDLYEIINKEEAQVIEKEGGVIYKFVVEGIKILSSGYVIFIVSNCQEWYLEVFFEQSGLKKFIKDTDCFEKSGVSKSEMIKRLSKKYNLLNPVYIGDTEWDKEAARLAGAEFIHMSYGFGNPAGEHKSFGSFLELVRFFMDHKQTVKL